MPPDCRIGPSRGPHRPLVVTQFRNQWRIEESVQCLLQQVWDIRSLAGLILGSRSLLRPWSFKEWHTPIDRGDEVEDGCARQEKQHDS